MITQQLVTNCSAYLMYTV